MPQGKGTYGSKKGRPKKPNAHHPMSFNFKRIQAVKTGKDVKVKELDIEEYNELFGVQDETPA